MNSKQVRVRRVVRWRAPRLYRVPDLGHEQTALVRKYVIDNTLSSRGINRIGAPMRP